MLISIHDVPRYERHLLFCSKLDPRKPRRRAPTAVPSGHNQAESEALAVESTAMIRVAAGFNAAGMTLGVA